MIGKPIHGRRGDRRGDQQIAYLQQIGRIEGSGDERFQVNFALIHGGAR